jgi:hypothetical protein
MAKYQHEQRQIGRAPECRLAKCNSETTGRREFIPISLHCTMPLDSERAFGYVPPPPALAAFVSREDYLSETARPPRGLMDFGPRAGDGKNRSPWGDPGRGWFLLFKDRRTGNPARRGPNASGHYPRACLEDLRRE